MFFIGDFLHKQIGFIVRWEKKPFYQAILSEGVMWPLENKPAGFINAKEHVYPMMNGFHPTKRGARVLC